MDSHAHSAAASAGATVRGERIVSFLDRQAACISPAWRLYLALFLLELVPAVAIGFLHSVLGITAPVTAGEWLAQIVRSDLGRAVLIGIVSVPAIETVLLWALARGGRAVLRSADAAIVLAALVLALTHLPSDALKIAAMSWGFFVQATVMLSRRLPHPFLTAWAIHVAHNALIMAVVVAAA